MIPVRKKQARAISHRQTHIDTEDIRWESGPDGDRAYVACQPETITIRKNVTPHPSIQSTVTPFTNSYGCVCWSNSTLGVISNQYFCGINVVGSYGPPGAALNIGVALSQASFFATRRLIPSWTTYVDDGIVKSVNCYLGSKPTIFGYFIYKTSSGFYQTDPTIPLENLAQIIHPIETLNPLKWKSIYSWGNIDDLKGKTLFVVIDISFIDKTYTKDGLCSIEMIVSSSFPDDRKNRKIMVIASIDSNGSIIPCFNDYTNDTSLCVDIPNVEISNFTSFRGNELGYNSFAVGSSCKQGSSFYETN